MAYQITAMYTSVLALLYLLLASRVVYFRRTLRIGLGADQAPALERAVRAHGNFAEYVPLALLLLLFLEAAEMPRGLLHVLGIALVVSRLLHAQGLHSSSGVSFGRFSGTMLTWLVVAFAALINIYLSFARWLLSGGA